MRAIEVTGEMKYISLTILSLWPAQPVLAVPGTARGRRSGRRESGLEARGFPPAALPKPVPCPAVSAQAPGQTVQPQAGPSVTPTSWAGTCNPFRRISDLFSGFQGKSGSPVFPEPVNDRIPRVLPALPSLLYLSFTETGGPRFYLTYLNTSHPASSKTFLIKCLFMLSQCQLIFPPAFSLWLRMYSSLIQNEQKTHTHTYMRKLQ